MVTISTGDPVAISAVTAIRAGDLVALRRLLAGNPWLATARLGDDDPRGMSRTLLHVVTDWPGHFPHGAAIIAALAEAGADVNARFRGPHEETPLHWAASSDDVEVLDALLDAGADIEGSSGTATPATVTGSGPTARSGRWTCRRAHGRPSGGCGRCWLGSAASMSWPTATSARRNAACVTSRR